MKGETTSEVSALSVIAVPPKNMKASGKLSPLTLPTSPSSPEALSAGSPEELHPYLSIECYDQLTKKIFPMDASMPITLTHKYQENKHARQGRGEASYLSGRKPNSKSGGSNNDLSTAVPPTAKDLCVSNDAITPVLKSPLPSHTMLNPAVSLPAAIPQPFSFPIMFHPTFTPTTPGTQLPLVYPSALTLLSINNPLSALQQFPMLSQPAHPNQYMMVDCSTFMWPPCSKVMGGSSGFNFMMPSGSSSVLQTPPSSAIQEKRKRCTPPPVASTMTTLASRPDTLSTGDSINESGSNSENTDSDSEDDMVTYLQEPLAPTEGTNNLPPCKLII